MVLGQGGHGHRAPAAHKRREHHRQGEQDDSKGPKSHSRTLDWQGCLSIDQDQSFAHGKNLHSQQPAGSLQAQATPDYQSFDRRPWSEPVA